MPIFELLSNELKLYFILYEIQMPLFDLPHGRFYFQSGILSKIHHRKK